MESGFSEIAAILLRFAHVVAAIMWIGNSLLFTWMELRLIARRSGAPDDDLIGHLDMLHGGGVFHLEKRILRPGAIPVPLYWFKWQSYTTWLTGFSLLCVLFYRDGSTLADATRSDLSGPASAGLSLAGLVIGWIYYDLLWRSPLGKNLWTGAIGTFVGIAAAAEFYGHYFNGRALYLQIGAMMATWMTANVFVHIMGNQHRFMRALESGQPHDPSFGKRAKSRSLHNHHLTFPVLFLMLSAHFPRLHAADLRVPILLVTILTLVAVKALMNARLHFRAWWIILTALVVSATAIVAALIHRPSTSPVNPEITHGRQVFEAMACGSCHMQGVAQIAPSLHGIYGTQQALADGTTVLIDESYLRESILTPQAKIAAGFAPAMPSFQDRLSEEELSALIDYVRSLTPTNP
ncbi:putative membrane protein [Haloferula luteola]|uniref:Putative membrane protein n=1 Tax=Haloferula luteola TaxID=595692 RepID=A0A840VC61_9BACT|nr:urate hydroxylase PuuD [Haloferula luteola]MBB5351510.1 putative membrane protein [Haloferula luteola]